MKDAKTRRAAGRGHAAAPGLRFDKVAIRVVERLQAAMDDAVPGGTTMVVTITAPIRLASKTTAAIEDRMRALLGRRPSGRDTNATIHGNRVRIRVLRHGLERAPRVIGFVHNPDVDTARLLDMARESLRPSS